MRSILHTVAHFALESKNVSIGTFASKFKKSSRFGILILRLGYNDAIMKSEKG